MTNLTGFENLLGLDILIFNSLTVIEICPHSRTYSRKGLKDLNLNNHGCNPWQMILSKARPQRGRIVRTN